MSESYTSTGLPPTGWIPQLGLGYIERRRVNAEEYITFVEAQLAAARADAEALRRNLRWAWAHLGCRCAFDTSHELTTTDAHCPIHGWQDVMGDPEGWENLKADHSKEATTPTASPPSNHMYGNPNADPFRGRPE